MRIRLSLVLLLTVITGALTAQETRAPFGNPINGIEVQIRLADGGDILNLAKVELFKGDMPLPHTYANIRGEASWVELPNGSYLVRVTLPGYLPGEDSVELMNGSNRRVIVMLHPDPNAVRTTTIAPDDPLVSVRYLAAPEQARKELEKSREARRANDCKDAVKHGKKAVEIASDFALAYVETGLCLVALNNLDEAQQYFTKALQLDGKFLYGYLELSKLYAKKKEWNEAAKTLGMANKALPERAEPFYELARLQLETGHPDRAEMAAKTALTKDYSRLPDLPFLLARAYVLQDKRDAALKTLQEIAEKDPKSVAAERARLSIAALQKADKTSAKPPAK